MGSLLLNGGFIGVEMDYNTNENYLTGDVVNLIGFGYGDNNNTDDVTINYPADADSDDDVFLIVVYEDNVVARPSISGFTVEIGENGTFENSACTRVAMKGKVGGDSSVTVPNIGAGSGKAVALAVVRGLDSDQSFSITMNNTAQGAAYSGSTNVGDGDAFLVLSVIDGTNDTYTQQGIFSANWDETFIEDGNTGIASSGRGGLGGIVKGNGTIENIGASISAPNMTSSTNVGFQYIEVTLSGNATAGNKKNSGIWSLGPHLKRDPPPGPN